MILIVEGIVMCFVLLIICVIGIANGPAGLVVSYEREVQDLLVNRDIRRAYPIIWLMFVL